MSKKTFIVRWLGTNSFEFRFANGASLYIDPYVSRHRELIHLPEVVDKYFTEPADLIVMTHAHWDHLPDVPQIVEKFKTPILYASKTACNIMRFCNVPEENLHSLEYGEVINHPNGMKITCFESRHKQPCDSTLYSEPPKKLEIAEDWYAGEVFAYLIEIDGLRIFNSGSANLCLDAVDGLECDYFFCGVSNFEPTFPELISHIKFKHIIPTHHDTYRKPFEEATIRDDFERLKKQIPGLAEKAIELPLTKFVSLEY